MSESLDAVTLASSVIRSNPELIVIIGLMVIGVVCLVVYEIRKASMHRQTEQTRREIAAYVAEGSISPQDAERILKARMPIDD